MPQELRNVAIIAHVDHGKTTLVDALFQESASLSRSQTGDRVLDRNDLERERGITILAKNASLEWAGVRVNLIDTPGHADFGGQVERVLSMADGALLVVDAREGPMPQTRFVLRKAFENRLRTLVVINKMDRADARPQAVISELFDLFVDLGAEDLALDFPVVFASARDGWAGRQVDERQRGMAPLLDAILAEFPPPDDSPEGPLQFQVSTLDWSDYTGRIGIGRVRRGTLRRGMAVAWLRNDGSRANGRIKEVAVFRGLEAVPAEEVAAGDVAAVAGIEDIGLGDTLCDPEHPEARPPIRVEEPTVEMEFRVNDGPLAGRAGRFVTSRQLAGRLRRAAMIDPALRVEAGAGDRFVVAGRGLLHLGILIETMRREGYEFCVGRPRVLFREEGGKRLDPLEEATLEIPEESLGRVIEFLGQRGAEITAMERRADQAILHLRAPTRGLLGAGTRLQGLTRGQAVLHSVPVGFVPWRGDFPQRRNGSLVVTEGGRVTPYALRALEDRGEFFVAPGDEVYAGMVAGEHCREADLSVNVVRARKLTNVRSSTKDMEEKLRAPRRLGLEAMLEFLAEDELLEVTPGSLRLRKRRLGRG